MTLWIAVGIIVSIWLLVAAFSAGQAYEGLKHIEEMKKLRKGKSK